MFNTDHVTLYFANKEKSVRIVWEYKPVRSNQSVDNSPPPYSVYHSFQTNMFHIFHRVHGFAQEDPGDWPALGGRVVVLAILVIVTSNVWRDGRLTWSGLHSPCRLLTLTSPKPGPERNERLRLSLFTLSPSGTITLRPSTVSPDGRLTGRHSVEIITWTVVLPVGCLSLSISPNWSDRSSKGGIGISTWGRSSARHMGQLLGDSSPSDDSHFIIQTFPKTWPHGSRTGSSFVKRSLHMWQVFCSSRKSAV